MNYPSVAKSKRVVKQADLNRLPDPGKLRNLADWIDIIDSERGASGVEVQQDLRAWAAYLEALRNS